ncbi:hypothetical protein FDG2_0934 [Candidatus Protofrankia californiensis]|uniref:Cell wall synthesis protein Wag31 n=1 Tax=Candidatus Protofrankia californiensis TaxID=1839754 RepID=A0A1C3NUL1_9ACTN|nr:hypothetical protein FDG2_0934 [Candidatus Protofrankia californiensis]
MISSAGSHFLLRRFAIQSGTVKRSIVDGVPQAVQKAQAPGRDDVVPIVFLSYADEDHARHGASIGALGSALETEISTRTGHRCRVLRDRREIGWCELWNEWITNLPDTTAILVAIMTPAFFRSAQCRHELERFLKLERQSNLERRSERTDLVLPIPWADDLDLAHGGTGDVLVEAMCRRVGEDWPSPHDRSPATLPAENLAEHLATGLARRLRNQLSTLDRSRSSTRRVPRVPRQPGSRTTSPDPQAPSQQTQPLQIQPLQVRDEQARPARREPPRPPVSPPGGERGVDGAVAYRPIVTAHDLCVKAFSATRLCTGYTMVGVDAFLDWAAAELRRLHALVRSVENGGKPDPGELVPRITPTEIRSTRFNPTRFFSGYRESEVDDFLRVVEREFANLHRFLSAVSAASTGAPRSGNARTDAARHRGGPGSFHPGITGSEVKEKSFTGTRFRSGYDIAQVDAFLDTVSRELDRLQAMVGSAQDGRPAASASHAVSLVPRDISDARFDTTWLTGGYSEYEVDDFLDFLERELTRVQDYLSRDDL